MSQAKKEDMHIKWQQFRDTGVFDKDAIIASNKEAYALHNQQVQESGNFRDQIFPRKTLAQDGFRLSTNFHPNLSQINDMAQNFADLR